MPSLSSIRDLLRGTISLFLPVFARPGDFMGKGWVRWVAHGMVLTCVLAGLAVLGTLVPVNEAFKAAEALPGTVWPPFLFLAVYLVSWLGWWAAGFLRRDPTTWPYLDLERRWEWIVRLLTTRSVPLQGDTPVYLVLGKPHGGYAAFFDSAEGAWWPRPDEHPPGACPLYAFVGGPGGLPATYLCWDLEHSRAEVTGEVGATAELLAAASRADVPRSLENFRHFCELLRRLKDGRVPVNGVLAFVPHQAISGQVQAPVPDVFWSSELKVIRDVLQVQCPFWIAFDMGNHPHFKRLIELEYARPGRNPGGKSFSPARRPMHPRTVRETRKKRTSCGGKSSGTSGSYSANHSPRGFIVFSGSPRLPALPMGSMRGGIRQKSHARLKTLPSRPGTTWAKGTGILLKRRSFRSPWTGKQLGRRCIAVTLRRRRSCATTILAPATNGWNTSQAVVLLLVTMGRSIRSDAGRQSAICWRECTFTGTRRIGGKRRWIGSLRSADGPSSVTRDCCLPRSS